MKFVYHLFPGERRDHPDQQSGRKLVRRFREREDRLLPHQLRSGHRAATQYVNWSHCVTQLDTSISFADYKNVCMFIC